MLTILILFELRPASGWERQLSIKSQLVLFATYFFPLPSIQSPALFATFEFSFSQQTTSRLDWIHLLSTAAAERVNQMLLSTCDDDAGPLGEMSSRENRFFSSIFQLYLDCEIECIFLCSLSHFSSLSHPRSEQKKKQSLHFVQRSTESDPAHIAKCSTWLNLKSRRAR